MKHVIVRSLHPRTVVFGNYGAIEPGKSVEVSLFDYKGSLESDPMWELVTQPKIPVTEVVTEESEAEAKTLEKVEAIREEAKEKQSSKKSKK